MRTSQPPLLVRADAGTAMGTGHAMRCLALAQAWHECGGEAHFAVAACPTPIRDRLEDAGVHVVHLNAVSGSQQDAEQTTRLAHEWEAGWVVVDGYQFGAGFQRTIKAAGLRLLFVDDYGHAGAYPADLVLNQNLVAQAEWYREREGYTRLLLGTEHAWLRREFWGRQGWRRTISPVAGRLLVTLGGADAENVTEKVLGALQLLEAPGLEAQVVVGGGNPHIDSLRAALDTVQSKWVGRGISLVRNATDMPERMAWADVAISSGGTTCWELALLQVPTLLLVLADNQRKNARAMAAAGAAIDLGWHADVTAERIAQTLGRLLPDAGQRNEMARRAGALVDGQGARRTAQLLCRDAVRVRPSAPQDREMLFTWANDPVTRAMSFHPEPIPWDEHVEWFRRVSADCETTLLVAESWLDGRWLPVGQVRVDPDGTLSIALAPEQRGRRLARPALQAAIGLRRARFPERALSAFVKPANAASHRVFSQAGFRADGQARVSDQQCVRYVYDSPPVFPSQGGSVTDEGSRDV